jgi:16S rRNA G1207 methylase RsmC
MSAVNLNYNALTKAFPWENLKGTVVDVGGGSGKVSITLAQVSKQLLLLLMWTSSKMDAI